MTRPYLAAVIAAVLVMAGCTRGAGAGTPRNKKMAASPAVPKGAKIAIFAGGCFWCIQPPYDKLRGVISTTVGYCGGKEQHPTYKQVAYGLTGHTEAIKIVYDPNKVSYDKLLAVLWRNSDPTDSGGQFVDRGQQYRPAVFTLDAAQHKAALASKQALGKSGVFKKPITIEISKATTFWPAETYHQAFYKKNPTRYYGYRRGSGRDNFIRAHWAKK